MAQQVVYYGQARAVHPGVNNGILQDAPIVADILESMANADTAVINLPATGDAGEAPRLVQFMRHTGGDSTSLASATFACNNGDQIAFTIDPNGKGDVRAYQTVTHSLVGVTNGAATAVQIAASINSDKNLIPFLHAVAGLTANAVTLFPILSNPTAGVAITVQAQTQPTGPTSNPPPVQSCRFMITQQPAVIGFPAGFTDYKARTYVSQTPVIAGGVGFSWAYSATARALTITNTTGGAVNRVCVLVQQ